MLRFVVLEFCNLCCLLLCQTNVNHIQEHHHALHIYKGGEYVIKPVWSDLFPSGVAWIKTGNHS